MLHWYKFHQGKIIWLGLILAFILGIAAPRIFVHLDFISNTFINLLKLCALPIVCTSLIVSIGGLSQVHQLKKIALNSAIYIIASEIIAVTIGLIIFNLFDVSKGINGAALLKGAVYDVPFATKIDNSQIFNYLFSANIFDSLVKFDVLPVVVFSIMFGLTCAFNQTRAKPVLEFFVSARDIFLQLLNAVMYLAPFAIFVLIGHAIADSYLTGSLSVNLFGLLKFVGLFFVALFIHFLWPLILVLVLYRHISLKRILTEAFPLFATAFISSSSLAALPIALEKAKELGGNRRVIDFMLPICASMNFASGMMYEITATLFFLHIFGIHPDLLTQIILAVACILTGIAVGGIPETSMVSFVTIFNMAHIPLSAISILMPLDRFVDRVRTMVNIFSNMCGTLIVSKSKI
jgi:proton glutamate symport protein